MGRTGDLCFCHCTEAKSPALSGSQMHEHSQEIDAIQEELIEETVCVPSLTFFYVKPREIRLQQERHWKEND